MSIGATLGLWISAAVGGFDNALIALAFLAAVDLVLGVAVAFKRGEYQSSKCYRGLFKKAFIFVMVAVCHAVDVALSVDFMRSAAIFAYAANEAMSILETVDRAGYGSMIPEPIRKALASVKERKENEVR